MKCPDSIYLLDSPHELAFGKIECSDSQRHLLLGSQRHKPFTSQTANIYVPEARHRVTRLNA